MDTKIQGSAASMDHAALISASGVGERISPARAFVVGAIVRDGVTRASLQWCATQ